MRSHTMGKGLPISNFFRSGENTGKKYEMFNLEFFLTVSFNVIGDSASTIVMGFRFVLKASFGIL